MNKKNFFRVIFCVALIAFIVCAAILLKLYLPEQNTMEQYKISESSTVITEPESSFPDNPIDFQKLQKTNADVHAWIKIPGTDIDYAVAQSSADKDDRFYLDHNIQQEYEFAGMIFSQKKNAIDFSDPVTVLYGHNMKNGSMFAGLHKFENANFFDKHDTIYIYTPGHILTYQIVSAYIYDDRHILNSFNFSKKKERKKYIQTIINPKSMVRNVRDGIQISAKDKIITLSTCTSNDSQRYLVQGVLKNDERTK